MNRRRILSTAIAASVVPAFARAQGRQPRRRKILFRSSWQTVNIGDIAHTPGMLALLEKHRPQDEITLWPNPLGADVEKILTTRFPKLRIANSPDEQQAALESCDFFLHGSGPALVGHRETERAQKAMVALV